MSYHNIRFSFRLFLYLFVLFLAVPYLKAQNVDGTSYANILPSNEIVTGIRGNSVLDPDSVIITGSQATNSGNTTAFLYVGSLSGATNTNSQVILFNPAFSNVISSTFYGPNTPAFNPDLGSSNIIAVGSYIKSHDDVHNHGMMYVGSTNGNGTWTSLDAPTSITPGGVVAYNTIAHSTMGDLVVGNYDIANVDPGMAFIYNRTTSNWSQLSVGTESTTAYGIWQYSPDGTKYVIAGGYNNISEPILTTGYLVNYNSTNDQISNLTSYSFNNNRAFITHFEGITEALGGLAMTADYESAGVSGAAYAFVPTNNHGVFGTASWITLGFPGAEDTSGNSVYNQSVIGLYVPGQSFLASIIIDDWNANNGSWELPANWTTGIPSNNEIVRIDKNNAAVTLANGTGLSGLLFIGDTNSDNSLALTSGTAFNNSGDIIWAIRVVRPTTLLRSIFQLCVMEQLFLWVMVVVIIV